MDQVKFVEDSLLNFTWFIYEYLGKIYHSNSGDVGVIFPV